MKKKGSKAEKPVRTGTKKTAKKAVKKEKVKKAKKEIKTKKQVKVKKEVKKAVKKIAPKKPSPKKPEKKVKEKAKKITPKKKITKVVEAEQKVTKEVKKIAMPSKKVARIPQRTIKKIEERAEISAIKPTEAKKTYPAVTVTKGLPAEYGEDRITLMIVDPWKLFAYWEAKEDTQLRIKDTLVLRVYDVTDIYFDGKNANITFDIPVHERAGNSYIGVGPGRVFIVDLGVLSPKGRFRTIARSNKVATPEVRGSKEEGIPKEIYEAGPTIGYF